MKKDRKKYLRYEEESNSNKINHPDNKKQKKE